MLRQRLYLKKIFPLLTIISMVVMNFAPGLPTLLEIPITEAAQKRNIQRNMRDIEIPPTQMVKPSTPSTKKTLRTEIDMVESIPLGYKSIHQEVWEMLQQQQEAAPPPSEAEKAEITPLDPDVHPRVNKTVFGYYFGKGYSDLQFDLLTHIGLFAIDAKSDGSISSLALTTNSGWYGAINKAHSSGVKVVIVVKNFSSSDIHAIVSDATVRATLIDNLLEMVKNNKLDGVSVDFEGPSSTDKDDITVFIKELADAFRKENSNYHISIATPGWAYTGSFNFPALAGITDAILMMQYDYYGIWSETTGPLAPLTSSGLSVDKSVREKYLDEGTPANKLVMLVPYSGRRWTVKKEEASTPGAKALSYVKPAPYITSSKNNINKTYDISIDTSGTYFHYFQQGESWIQGWTDDPSTIVKKYDYARSKNLQGVGMFGLDYGGGYKPLWEAVESRFISAPDLTIVSSSLRMIEKGSGSYDVVFKLNNTGDKAADKTTVCFRPEDISSCIEPTAITEPIAAGATSSSITISLEGFTLPAGDKIGEIRIYDVVPAEGNKDNNKAEVKRSHLETLSSNDPQGVDFTSFDLGGIEIDSATNSIDFILKGITGTGEAINPDEYREKMRQIFMTALVIPNWKQWISLPLCGEADIESPFEKTELARIMLEADVKMKFDLFHPNSLNLTNLYAEWVNLVKDSPYWSEIKAQGFNSLPSWEARGTIVPKETLVNVEGDKIFLNSATLTLNTFLDWASIDLASYNFRSEAANDINERFETWKQMFRDQMVSLVPTISDKFNSDSSYQELKEVYPVVALAHWYKTLDRQGLPYADLIDSENMTGLDEVSFDANYWAGQSCQHIGDFSVVDFYGNTQSWYIYGGVELGIASPTSEGELTEAQENILTQVLENYTYLQEGSAYYLYGGNMSVPRPDLTGNLTISSDSPVIGRPIQIQVNLFNSGEEDTGNFKIKIQSELTPENGRTTLYSIAEKEIPSLTNWAEYIETINWTLPEIVGEHKFTLLVDSNYQIKESNENNNTAEQKLETITNVPTVVIASHLDGSLVSPFDVIFEGYAYDNEEGILPSESLVWASSLDGQLGVGPDILVDSLSSGLHTITLTAVDSEGITATDKINITVPKPGPPVVKITSPSSGSRHPSGIYLVLGGQAMDYEDGVLSGESLVWESSKDGTLGSGEWLSLNTLSIGNHLITLMATDSSSLSTADQISITIEQGPPTVSISSPAEGAKFYQNEEVDLAGTAADRQDGDLSWKIEWYSDRDGLLGEGASLSVTLSPGEHTLTLYVIDSDGQEGEVKVNVTVNYTPPVATLSSPEDGVEFTYFSEITFVGSATDVQDGELSEESLIWESSQNGFLGTGSPLIVSNLAPGTHIITFKAIDSDEVIDIEEISIYIDAGQPRVTVNLPSEDQNLFWGYPYTFSGSAYDEQEGDLTGSSLVWLSNLDGEIGTGQNFSTSTLSVGDHIIALRATDSEGWIGEEVRNITVIEPHAPEVSLIKPRNGESFIHGDLITFKATAWDFEDGNLSGTSTEWRSSIDGLLGNGITLILDSTPLSLGTHTITFKATDNLGASQEVSTTISITNRPPEAKISSPTTDDNIFVQDENITFLGSGIDLEDGALSGSALVWESSVNGTLGTGVSLTIPVSNLDAGTHTITLTVTDSNGASVVDKINIIIVASGSELLNTLSDGSTEYEIEYSRGGGGRDETVYLKLPSYAKVTNTQIDLTGEKVGPALNIVDGPYATGMQGITPAFVDIDSDRDQDLFMGTNGGAIRYYRNNGTTSSPKWNLVTENYADIEGNDIAYPSFIDINNDGDYDMFIGNYDGTISYYENIGSSKEADWAAETENYAFIDVGTSAILTFVDINNDGDYDMFIGNYYDGAISYYENIGDKYNASWNEPKKNYADIKTSYSSPAPFFVDIDNDEDYDLFVAGKDTSVYNSFVNLYLNIGDKYEPVWEPGNFSHSHVGFSSMATSTFVDIDNDDDYDWFIGTGAYIVFYENEGSPSSYQFSNPSADISIYFGAGSTINSPTFADFDNDGDYDFVYGSSYLSYGIISFVLNNGSDFSPLWWWSSNNYFYTILYNLDVYPTFIDIDNDGDLDLFVGDFSYTHPSIHFYRNDGYDEYPWIIWTLITDEYAGVDVGYGYVAPTFTDIDNDKDYDLFVGQYDGTISYYENIGNKNDAEWAIEIENYAGIDVGQNSYLVFSDIDNDGDYDLFIGADMQQIYYYENIGDEFTASWDYQTDTYNGIKYKDNINYNFNPTFVDIDNDGTIELFIGDMAGGLSIWDDTSVNNPHLKISSNESDFEWSYSGELVGTETTSNFAAEINEYLATATPDEDGNVLIPFVFHSDTAGILKINNINVQYTTTDTEEPVFGEPGFTMAAVTSSGYITPNPVYAGEAMTISVYVTDNQGVASVTANINGSDITLAPQGGDVYAVTVNAPSVVGEYVVTITATDINGIPASAIEELTVLVSGRELVLNEEDLSISNTIPDETEVITVNTEVHNYGDTQASFYVDFLVDGLNVARSDSITLGGNFSQTVNFNWTATYGADNLSIQVDSTGAVSEPDETNNLATQSINVRDITPPTLTNITLSPNPASVTQTVALTLEATDNAALEDIIATIDDQSKTLTYNSGTGQYETSFNFTQAGDYEVEILATDVNSLQTLAVENLKIYWSRPDFKITPKDITLSNPDPLQGEEIIITLATHNVGYEAANNIKVHFLVNGELANEQYVNLAAPATVNLDFRWKAQMGSHTLEFAMDPESAIAETEENNNKAYLTISIDKVDIPTISQVLLPDNVVENNTFLLEVDLSGAQMAGGKITGDEQVTAITDYETVELEFNSGTGLFEGNLNYPEMGNKDLEVKAQAPEGSSYAQYQDVLVRSMYPDFSLDEKELALDKIKPSAGEDLSLNLHLENLGGKLVENVPVNFLVDGQLKETMTISEIDIGAEASLEFIWPTEIGNHTLVFEVDPENTVFESSEENNIISRNIEVIDKTPPEITQLTHDKAIFEGGTLAISVEALDNVEIQSVTAAIAGSNTDLTYNSETELYEGNLIVSASGDQELVITVRDNYNLNTVFTKRVEIYSLEPDLTLDQFDLNLNTDSIVEGVSLSLEVTVHNNGGTATGTFSVYLEIDGLLVDFANISLGAGQNQTFEFDWTPDYGEHTVKVNVDPGNAVSESNESNNSYTKTLYAADITAPVAPAPSAWPDSWTSTNNFTISWSAVSDPQGIKEYSYNLDGSQWKSLGTSTSINLTDIEEGAHTVSVRAEDTQGNISEAGSTTIYFDSSSPEAPVLQELHSGASWTTHTSPYFSWSEPVDTGSGVISYLGSLDGDEENLIDLDSDTFYHPELAVGEHSFKVKAVDQMGFGSEWSNIVIVKIDTEEPPAVAITSATHPDPDTPTNNNTPEFSWTTPEDLSGIAGYYYLFSPNANDSPNQYSLWLENQGQNNTLVINSLKSMTSERGVSIPDGTWYLHLVAKDNVGNISTQASTYQIIIDTGVSLLLPMNPQPADKSLEVGINTPLAWNVQNSCSKTATVDYEIYLDSQESPSTLYTTLDDTACDQTRLTIAPLPQLFQKGTTYFWKVTSRDEAGNLTEGAVWQFMTSAAASFLDPIETLEAQAGFKSINLNWSEIPTSSEFFHFNIYRETQEITTVSGLTPYDQSLTDNLATSFIDYTAESSTNYYYAVTAIDLWGNENKEVFGVGPVKLKTLEGIIPPSLLFPLTPIKPIEPIKLPDIVKIEGSE